MRKNDTKTLKHMPNFSHKTILSAKKGDVYATESEAVNKLVSLRNEYPTSAMLLPTRNKLLFQIYSKKYNPPFKKYILEVVHGEDGWFLKLEENKGIKLVKGKVYEFYDTISSYLLDD